MKSVCIYCGSSSGTSPEYADAAVQCARALVARGVTIVYGGGNIGIMGIVADAALQAGGKVVGVIPDVLVDKELAHRGVTELIQVRGMHERKQTMANMADGFIALPGGIGTLDELCEILTWRQLGFHNKPVALLNTAHYYDLFIGMLRQMQSSGFIPKPMAEQILVDKDIEVLLTKMTIFIEGLK